jgi:hypothetical protein
VLRAEVRRETSKRDTINRAIDRWFDNQANYEAQKRDKQHEIDQLKAELALLEGKDVDLIKEKIRNLYKEKGKDNTRPEINSMISLLLNVEMLEKERQKAQGVDEVGLVEQDLKDIKTKLEELDRNLLPHESFVTQFKSYGKNSNERALNKLLTSSQLTKFQSEYEAVKELRKLSEEEEKDLEAIIKKIKGELKEEKEKTDLIIGRLRVVLGAKAEIPDSDLHLND